MVWCYCAGCGGTVDMMVDRQPSYVMWSCYGVRHRLLISRGHRTGAGGRTQVVGHRAAYRASSYDPEL
jgi:hypothetical protein